MALVRFYLDEHDSQTVAVLGRGLGIDIISSHECGRDGTADDVQLQFAGSEGRCFVTRNYRHLIPLTLQFQQEGLPHAGLLCIPRSLAGDQFHAIAEALSQYSRLHPEGLPPYTVDWLLPHSANA